MVSGVVVLVLPAHDFYPPFVRLNGKAVLIIFDQGTDNIKVEALKSLVRVFSFVNDGNFSVIFYASDGNKNGCSASKSVTIITQVEVSYMGFLLQLQN